MDATLRNKARELCELLTIERAGNVIGLEMSRVCSWTSHLVIGTVSSRIHMKGLGEAVINKMRELGIETRFAGKRANESSWRIIDGGDIVVSLMDSASRGFYTLEERWFESEVFYSTSKEQSTDSLSVSYEANK